jgi:hypothetical protein
MTDSRHLPDSPHDLTAPSLEPVIRRIEAMTDAELLAAHGGHPEPDSPEAWIMAGELEARGLDD